MERLFHGGLTISPETEKSAPPGFTPGRNGPFIGGRYWVRTSDLFGVNEARYHCANRPDAFEC